MAENWTPDRVETLKKLLAEGLSASGIAERIEGGFTRNAVIGKAGRMGLLFARGARARHPGGIAAKPTRVQDPKPRLKPVSVLREIAERMKASGARVQAPKFNPQPYEPAAIDLPTEPLRLPLLKLEDSMCRFPLGDPKDAGFSFCALPRADDKPYCPHHVSAAYVGLPVRKIRHLEQEAA